MYLELAYPIFQFVHANSFKFARDWNEFMRMIQARAMKAMTQTSQLDIETRTRIVKELLEHFPQTKKPLKDWSDYVSQLL